VPEQFVDRQALIMVLDFGKLYFTNRGDPNDTKGKDFKKKFPMNLILKEVFRNHSFLKFENNLFTET
jgi:hypothetical protein